MRCFRRKLLPVLLLATLPAGPVRASEPASLGGTTGLLNIPVASVTPDGVLHAGYNLIDRDASYEGRGTLDNRVYFITLGFLPRTEVSIRATVLPGESHIEGLKADGIDRMGSARFLLIQEKSEDGGAPELRTWPGLAVGMDDIEGTRRFHSFYLVTTKSFALSGSPFRGSLTAGYGFRSFSAGRYLLDGEFGGADIYLGKWAAFIVEYDSEKWNGGLRLFPALSLTAQMALLNLDTPSGGVSWTHHF